MVCLALELVGSWVVLGFIVGMEAFNELLSIKCSLESGFLWCSQDLDLSLLLLVFSLIFTVVSRLLLLYRSEERRVGKECVCQCRYGCV